MWWFLQIYDWSFGGKNYISLWPHHCWGLKRKIALSSFSPGISTHSVLSRGGSPSLRSYVCKTMALAFTLVKLCSLPLKAHGTAVMLFHTPQCKTLRALWQPFPTYPFANISQVFLWGLIPPKSLCSTFVVWIWVGFALPLLQNWAMIVLRQSTLI